jgi:hypothetical protein
VSHELALRLQFRYRCITGLTREWESISQGIDLEDNQPDVVGKMVDFLYGLDYDDHRSAAEGPLPVNGSQSVACPPFGNSHEIPVEHTPVDTENPEKYNPLFLINNRKSMLSQINTTFKHLRSRP